MNKTRSGGMTAIAVLNFIFAGIGILVALFGIITGGSFMSNPMLGAKGPQIGMLILAASLLSLPSAGAAIVSGIGILKLSPWGRTWTFVYAILGVVGTLFGLVVSSAMQQAMPTTDQANHPVISLIIGCIYPAILFYLVSTRKWKETFSNVAVEVA